MSTRAAAELIAFRDFLDEQIKHGPPGLTPEESLRLWLAQRDDQGGPTPGEPSEVASAHSTPSAGTRMGQLDDKSRAMHNQPPARKKG
jgi:hypothetical protein